MKHSFNVNIAKEFSIEIAIFLDFLAHWTLKNLANDKHIYDGYCWSYNTLNAMTKLFPYWTKRQCEWLINNAEKAGLIVKGNYNHTKYDRTMWYAMTQKSCAYFPELSDEIARVGLYSPISQKCEMEKTEMRNGYHKNVTPIPITIPVTDHNNNLLIDSKPKSIESESFSKFWAKYPNKIGKKKCLAIWNSRGLDSKVDAILEKLDQQIRADDHWLQGFIPHPSTYLNQDRWEDEIILPKEEVARKRKEEAVKIADQQYRERMKIQEAESLARRNSNNQHRKSSPISLKESLLNFGKNLHQKATLGIENLGPNLTPEESSL